MLDVGLKHVKGWIMDLHICFKSTLVNKRYVNVGYTWSQQNIRFIMLEREIENSFIRKHVRGLNIKT